MTPAFYIPLWFNITLFASGITLIFITFYALLSKKCPWFVIIPLFAYGIHFAIFYGFISFAQLTGHILDNETMTFWSAVLRLQGVMTALVMVFIINLTFGKKCNE
jgi:hypothetical protein